MAEIKVVFPPVMLCATGGNRETIVSASTVREALKQVYLKYEEAFKPWASPFARRPNLLNFFVNGVHIHSLDKPETRLRDGDVIQILLAATGG